MSRRRRVDAEFVALYADLRAQERLGIVERLIKAVARHDRIWVEEIQGPATAVWIVTAASVTFHLLGTTHVT